VVICYEWRKTVRSLSLYRPLIGSDTQPCLIAAGPIIAMTLNVLEGRSPIASRFKCDLYVRCCAPVDKISIDMASRDIPRHPGIAERLVSDAVTCMK